MYEVVQWPGCIHTFEITAEISNKPRNSVYILHICDNFNSLFKHSFIRIIMGDKGQVYFVTLQILFTMITYLSEFYLVLLEKICIQRVSVIYEIITTCIKTMYIKFNI